MKCANCGKNEFFAYDEICHDAHFDDDGDLVIGAETDNRLSEVVCKHCSQAVEIETIPEVIW